MLMLAAKNGAIGIVSTILRNETNTSYVNAADTNLRTSLMFAAAGGHADTSRVLLDKGANIDAVDEDGRTALMMAVAFAPPTKLDVVVALLLQRGANPNVADKAGETALSLATRRNATRIVNMLVGSGAENTQKNSKDVLELLRVIAYGSHDAVRLLLEQGADVNGVCSEVTPLMCAAEHDSPEIVETLLKRGADVNFANRRGETALMRAARKDLYSNVDVLLRYGAEIDAINREGFTALAIAARENNTDTILELVNNGADIHLTENVITPTERSRITMISAMSTY